MRRPNAKPGDAPPEAPPTTPSGETVESLRAERDAAHGERDGLRRENERLAQHLRAAQEDQSRGSSLADRLRAIAHAASLDHIASPSDMLDAVRTRVEGLRADKAPGFTGVKRFQGVTTVMAKDGTVVNLTPGMEIPEGVDVSKFDPRLITVE